MIVFKDRAFAFEVGCDVSTVPLVFTESVQSVRHRVILVDFVALVVARGRVGVRGVRKNGG